MKSWKQIKKISLSYAPQKVKTEKSDNYREVTQDRVFAGIREGYFIYMIQSEVFDTNQLEDKDEGHFTDEVLVRYRLNRWLECTNFLVN